MVNIKSSNFVVIMLICAYHPYVGLYNYCIVSNLLDIFEETNIAMLR